MTAGLAIFQLFRFLLALAVNTLLNESRQRMSAAGSWQNLNSSAPSYGVPLLLSEVNALAGPPEHYVRVLGRLISFDPETYVAVIEEDQNKLAVQTSWLDFAGQPGVMYLFIGSLTKSVCCVYLSLNFLYFRPTGTLKCRPMFILTLTEWLFVGFCVVS